jgi:hypothetical protein
LLGLYSLALQLILGSHIPPPPPTTPQFRALYKLHQSHFMDFIYLELSLALALAEKAHPIYKILQQNK